MNRRIPLALVAAALISGSCTYVLAKRLKFETAAQRKVERYVAPNRAIEAGEVLRAQDLDWVAWPLADSLHGALTQADAAVGRVVLYPLDKGQPVLDRDLAAAGTGAGLGSRIPPGMRAVALRSDEVVGVAGFLAPGSRLDVLVSYHAENGSAAVVTSTVVQNAEVLAAGQQMEPDPTGKPSVAAVVTLLLTPLDAERAVAASTQGAVHFVLRNVLDKQAVDSAPVSLGGPVAPSALPPPGTSSGRVRRPSPRPGTGVQTILGDGGDEVSAGGKSNQSSLSGGPGPVAAHAAGRSQL